MKLCNDINLNANQKMHYDRLDIAQKVTEIKKILKTPIINPKQLGLWVFQEVRLDIDWSVYLIGIRLGSRV